mmetsp:Transcript_8816/g.14945  ORF Transcript_8816/g.14945 Transcript_8816/m.14945 type:complete len:184 (-) Transcript_8816:33-584(-)
MLSEFIIGDLKIMGPSPTLFDLRNTSFILSDDPVNESYADASFLAQGPIETSLSTEVNVTWPKELKFKVYVRVLVESFCGKIRVKFSCKNPKDNYLQWIGKPQLRISIEPIIGADFDVKQVLPKVKSLIDGFISAQLCSFEKVPLIIPFQRLSKCSRFCPMIHVPERAEKESQASLRELMSNI